jgi:hypothetical protein
MNRRDFMKLAGATGLVLASPLPSREAHAQDFPSDKPLYLFVGMSGGCDPTYFCDPKGFINTPEDDDVMNRPFAAADIGNAGNIRYAPVGYYPTFVEKHYEKMLVINGIDTETNGHDSGRRHIGSGKLQEGFPAFGALVAAQYGRGLPMGFITNGFYDNTAGTTPRTRVGNIRAFERIARPNNPDPGNDRLFHTEDTMQRIQMAQQSRLEAMRQASKLPKIEKSIGTLHLARSSDNVLARLLEFLPDDGPNNGLQRQAQLAIAAYKAGACVSAVLSQGGFDTHGNHDNNHLPRLDSVFEGVDYIWEEAERQGVADRVVVVIGSDFGRTPGYNENMGKDHWSVTSMILMGQGIQGNRTIGETTYRHALKEIDEGTMAAVEQPTSGSVRIKPAHVHLELRKHAGLDATELNAMFPLDIDSKLPLFG